ncbi:MAG: hypothetical protein MK086_04995 [Flavobacteriales bacterium]|nr:hypothetical protein [Flavobacteriales bacterium]
MIPILEKYGLRRSDLKYISRDDATAIELIQGRMNWKGKVGLGVEYKKYELQLNRIYKKALKEKVCYFGPFKGEFGHFLLHNLLFLMHLHHKGVKIHYCGMSLHQPFMVDSKGNSIVESFTELRDFFGDIKPSANQNKVPRDINEIIKTWSREAKGSGRAFFNIDKSDFYWHGLRNWQLEGRQHKYDLSKAYAENQTDSVVIFPRKKGGEATPNNGGPWDYMEIARRISPYFEKVYLVGHTSLSAHVVNEGNIEVKVSTNNADTLKYCAESKLIVTQHSGAVHLGAYVNKPVLLIYKGQPPIKGLFDTLRFRKNLTRRGLKYAFSLEEIEKRVVKYSDKEPSAESLVMR